MSSSSARRSASELAIGLMVCGAAYLFVIAPAEEKAGRLQAEADALSKPVAGGAVALSDGQLKVLTDAARATAREIDALGAPARDEAELFGRIMSLASSTGVSVEQLQPVAVRSAAVTPAATPDNTPADGAQPKPPADSAVGYSISLGAPYANVLAFLKRLESDVGLTVVRGVRIEPGQRQASDHVTARIETEHYAFDVAGVLGLIEPAPHHSPASPVATAAEKN